MLINSILLKQFRCFSNKTLNFKKPIVLIEGPNGSGKTSILEALHYACYLRSFKTRTTKELINFDENSFSIKIQLSNQYDHENHENRENIDKNQENSRFAFSLKEDELASAPKKNDHENNNHENCDNDFYKNVDANKDFDKNINDEKITIFTGYSYSPAKRVVKINNLQIDSHKELLENYRAVTVTDDDVFVIKGYPENRRLFLDQTLLLINPDYGKLLKKYNDVLVQRNALLASLKIDQDSYDLWTDQIMNLAEQIRENRKNLIVSIEKIVNNLLEKFFDLEPSVKLSYKLKEQKPNFALQRQEQFSKRSLVGSHLDDLSINFNEKSSKQYSSKGQQKLVSTLLKIAYYASQDSQKSVFLLDDILSDLDDKKLKDLFKLLNSCQTQLIVTSPHNNPLLSKICSDYDHEIIDLSSF